MGLDLKKIHANREKLTTFFANKKKKDIEYPSDLQKVNNDCRNKNIRMQLFTIYFRELDQTYNFMLPTDYYDLDINSSLNKEKYSRITFHITSNEQLEKPVSDEKMKYCLDKINSVLTDDWLSFDNVTQSSDLVTIADYRRKFNEKYCDEVDVLMWGESDSLIPHRTFSILHYLHKHYYL